MRMRLVPLTWALTVVKVMAAGVRYVAEDDSNAQQILSLIIRGF